MTAIGGDCSEESGDDNDDSDVSDTDLMPAKRSRDVISYEYKRNAIEFGTDTFLFFVCV